MRVDQGYREALSIWVSIAGGSFPRLTRKIRTTLASETATEADYADLIGEVNRAGGPRIVVANNREAKRQAKSRTLARGTEPIGPQQKIELPEPSSKTNKVEG